MTRAHLDRSLLPDPNTFYQARFGSLGGRGEWQSALCPFHPDRRPSLRVNVVSGAYRCMACGASGGDLVEFVRADTGLGFVDAAKQLRAWVPDSVFRGAP